MRLDLPQNLPRRRAPETPHPAPLLDPSPIELRREALAATAVNRRPMPQPKRTRVHEPDRSRKAEGRRVDPDRTLDRRPRRESLPQHVLGLPLREEERNVLREVGRFRVIQTRDLAETIYNGRHSRMERDLAFLREKGLVDVNAVNARRDGRGGRVERIEVVTLTRDGQSLLRMTGELPKDQKVYAGLVKPREVEHDSQIYRAYQKHAARIERSGGTNLRVRLDFELKSQVQKAIYAARKADPERDLAEIKAEVAERFDLPLVNGQIQVPDARIEYEREPKPDDRDQGSRSAHEDIEVVTAAYRPAHLRAKAQSGFHAYASSRDRATLTARIEDEHGLMAEILEL